MLGKLAEYAKKKHCLIQQEVVKLTKKYKYQRLPSEHRVQYRHEFDVSRFHVIPMLSSK